MGMFNYVDFECVCPVCHSKVDGFQTKDGDLRLDTVKPKSVSNFYAPCRKCGCWIEFTRNDDGKFVRTVDGKIGDKTQTMPEHTKVVRI